MIFGGVFNTKIMTFLDAEMSCFDLALNAGYDAGDLNPPIKA